MRGSAVMWMTVTARARCCRLLRCGRRRATRSCDPPQSDGGAGGAQTVASDGELIGEEAAAEEVLVPEAIAVGSSLERVLDVAVGTMVHQGGSDKNGGGQWWRSPTSRGGWVRAEQR
jgi:hypothetical protein